MKICDLCSNEVEELNTLQENWQAYKVKEVCNECLEQLRDYNLKVQSVIDKIMIEQKQSFYKRIIKKLKK